MENNTEAAPEIKALTHDQVNFDGALAAAKALAGGKPLDEALKIGSETPATAVPQLDPVEPDEPDEVPDNDEARRDEIRRYLRARINAKRNPDLLTDAELADAAMVLEGEFCSSSIFAMRVQP